jgi:hypothetical protein
MRFSSEDVDEKKVTYVLRVSAGRVGTLESRLGPAFENLKFQTTQSLDGHVAR